MNSTSRDMEIHSVKSVKLEKEISKRNNFHPDPSLPPIPRCPFNTKNSMYVQLLQELKEGKNPRMEYVPIPVLKIHPSAVQSGMIYFFTGDPTDHKTLEGTFDQNGRPTKLYDPSNPDDKKIVGFKRTYMLKNHNRGDGFRFGKWLFSLEGFDTILLHFYSKTHPDDVIQFKEMSYPYPSTAKFSRDEIPQPPRTPNSQSPYVHMPNLEHKVSLPLPITPNNFVPLIVPSFNVQTESNTIRRNEVRYDFNQYSRNTEELNRYHAIPHPNPPTRLITINGLKPYKGSPSKETGVKVIGSGFTPGCIVYWGTKPLQTAFISENELWCFAPPCYTEEEVPVFISDYPYKSTFAKFYYTDDEPARKKIKVIKDKLHNVETRFDQISKGTSKNEVEEMKREFERIYTLFQEFKEEISTLQPAELEQRLIALQLILFSNYDKEKQQHQHQQLQQQQQQQQQQHQQHNPV